MTKNVQSHNYTKGIIKSYLLWCLETIGVYKIVKINEGDNTIYEINVKEDIDKFLKTDNNFYFNVKGLFGTRAITSVGNYYLTPKQTLTPDNESIEKIKIMEEYWSNNFENAYFNLMKKIYNVTYSADKKFKAKIEKQIDKIVSKESNRKIILEFIGLNLFRTQFLKGKELAWEAIFNNNSQSITFTKLFWEENVSQRIFDNLDFLNEVLTIDNVNAFIASVTDYFKDYDIQIIENLAIALFTNPCFISLFNSDVLIIPRAFKNLSLVLIKKNHVLEYELEKGSFSLVESKGKNGIFLTFQVKAANAVSENIISKKLNDNFFSLLLNSWFINYGIKDGSIYLIDDSSDLDFLKKVQKTKDSIKKERKKYYDKKGKNKNLSEIPIILKKEK